MIRLPAIALLLLLPACASKGTPTSFPVSEDGEGLDRGSLRIEVDNQHFSDATIYAADGSYRVRLGRVNGKSTASFTFRWNPHQLTMFVDFTGGGTRRSNQFPVFQGVDDNLFLIIGSRSRIWMGRKGG